MDSTMRSRIVLLVVTTGPNVNNTLHFVRVGSVDLFSREEPPRHSTPNYCGGVSPPRSIKYRRDIRWRMKVKETAAGEN